MMLQSLNLDYQYYLDGDEHMQMSPPNNPHADCAGRLNKVLSAQPTPCKKTFLQGTSFTRKV